ncbi:MAG: 3-oxoacyl-ACP synthase [Epsilonproteobacteria bacterium (ex Lamellibrachia satsuma)]|nr:MAG: 3-oxoacyl-ACP synthase [Epsilonproteobacteria bacterium (ex Lamellibrachia satsuma)]
MASVNILNYEIHSAQGDLHQTLNAIKNEEIILSSKFIKVDQKEINIPFYAFENEVQEEQESIYGAIRELLLKLVSGMSEKRRRSTALIIGTSLVDLYLVDAIEACVYESERTVYSSQKHSIDSYAKKLSNEFGLNEFTMTINTACTSSANAMLEASNLIRSGVFDYAIVLGVEIFSSIMSSGFYTMDLISDRMPKPFDINRNGLVLGEAIAGILLGKDDSKWSIEGGFSNCNSSTITSVGKGGDECVEVMQKALEDANIVAEDITALKAHATGSESNDLAEINAISKVFDDTLIFTALKPYVGHTIGASGALEIAIFMATIDNGFIPKTLSCTESILADYIPISESKECKSGLFMCNYFGFGGNNISLIIKKASS